MERVRGFVLIRIVIDSTCDGECHTSFREHFRFIVSRIWIENKEKIFNECRKYTKKKWKTCSMMIDRVSLSPIELDFMQTYSGRLISNHCEGIKNNRTAENHVTNLFRCFSRSVSYRSLKIHALNSKSFTHYWKSRQYHHIDGECAELILHTIFVFLQISVTP